MASQSPRTAEILRDRGYFVEKVEQVVHGTFIKRDCFGAFDLLAVKADEQGALGVQICASDRKADHVAKLREIEAVWAWLRAKNRILIHSWRKRKERNASTGNWGTAQWAVVEIDLQLQDLQPEPDWTIIRAKIAKAQAERKAASLAKRQVTIAEKQRVSAAARAAAGVPTP
jgi:hypothetical protein